MTSPTLTPEVVQSEGKLNEVIELLKTNSLPHRDVRWEGNLMIGYRHVNRAELVGSGGLEFYGTYALLRSVAVSAPNRGQSFGQQIVDDLLQRAKGKGLTAVYLFTETAHDFFIKKGFRDINREGVPPEVKVSSEFTSVCPVSAACMVYPL